jgi:hypothetical protein
MGLRRVSTYTGDYLWLCKEHYEDFQPKIPDEIRFDATEATSGS